MEPPVGDLVGYRHALASAFTARHGVVSAFDDHLGAGVITEAETGEAWYFHCTRIADGSRAISVGTGVAFRAQPGPTGLEAVAVGPQAPSA
ncbi:MAG: hypothetical protein JWO68_990 [Actinomycetia bacterium]|nr:hypothetical protein [Actinomycetes bacterium]